VPALDLIGGWPVGTAAAGYVVRDGPALAAGDRGRPFPLASVTKLLAGMAILVAVEEGSVGLDEPADDVPGATLRHLLAHTSGLPFEGAVPIARPGARRVYSNTGIERAAAQVARRTAIPFPTYLDEAVLAPLGMTGTTLGDASPAAGASAPIEDLLRLGRELLAPAVLAPETLAEATSVQFPGLAGVLPGIGQMDPCDWGLTFEIRDAKSPHWTGRGNAPATFGHFGGSGTFLWVDPVAGVALAVLTDRGFGAWALEAWPDLADAVLAEVAAGDGHGRDG
jgi:CubicO group peptidase (beta-lactamase class C family)